MVGGFASSAQTWLQGPGDLHQAMDPTLINSSNALWHILLRVTILQNTGPGNYTGNNS